MTLRLSGALVAVAILLFVLTRTAVHYVFLAVAAYSYPLIDTVDQRFYIPSNHETMTRLVLQSVAGQITLSPGASEIISGTAHYNVAEFAPIVEFDVDGTRSQVLMRPRNDLEVTRLLSPGNRTNHWDLQIGTEVPYRTLVVNMGAGQVQADMGGVVAETVEIFIGTGELTLGTSNAPFEAEEVEITMGSGAVNLDLRSSEVHSASVQVGLGDSLIDLRSGWTEGSRLYVMNGMGNTTLILPEDVAVEVQVADGASITEAPELVKLERSEEVEGRRYVNDAYEQGLVMLHITVENGFGTVELLTHESEKE